MSLLNVGIIGLAQTNDSRSVIKSLKDYGKISKMIVALNYENPKDTHTSSKITFGEIDFT